MANHVMIDLETLGVVPGCVAFSIGAVEFCPDALTLGKEFYTLVSVENSRLNYLSVEPDTEAWWRKQSAEARRALEEAMTEDAPTLFAAMNGLNDFLRRVGAPRNLRLWGNGADFDNPIIRVMYSSAGVEPYAGGYGGRCYRTMKNIGELFGPLEFTKMGRSRTGTHHNALDDAKSQAIHLMDNIAKIRKLIGATK